METEIKLNESEWSTVTHALRVAADRFAEDARELRERKVPYNAAVNERLAAQFDKQAAESRALANKIEE